jgi:hypothetical protein
MSAQQFIEQVYALQSRIAAKDSLDVTVEELERFKAIGAALDYLYEIRRAELVFEQHGPPRMISAPDPRSQKQVRRFAVGMAPLPSGGD